MTDSKLAHEDDAPHHASHGNTPAAWTAVVLGLLGFAVGGIGLMFEPAQFVIFWIGVGIVVAAGVVFIVMDRLGMGV